MGDDEDEELVYGDGESAGFERELFAAIRDYNRLNQEIDDELRHLVEGRYEGPSIAEPGAESGGAS
jgi:hypothetical protein